MFEGEPLVLRCRGWYDKAVSKLHYYHDGRAVRYFHAGANYSVPQARSSDSGLYQCSGTMRIPVESAPMFSAKVVVTVQELFQTPVLRVIGGARAGDTVLRCDTQLHPHKRDTPLQFAFYKYSRPVRRFDWAPDFGVPEPEQQELEAFWCEAATVTRSVRKRSPWMQTPIPESPMEPAPTSTPVPQARGEPLSVRKPPVSRAAPVTTSLPNVTWEVPTRRDHSSAAAPACTPPEPWGPPGAPRSEDVALLLREMRQLKDLLSRVVQGLQGLSPSSEAPEGPGTSTVGKPQLLETTTVYD